MTDTLERLKAALADRYAIQEEIGAGGMATVYLAEDLKHRRKVAVKVLRPELAAVLGSERFLKEIEVTANLQHPNILPLYDSGEAGGFLYYVMPFIEGESLRDKLDREKQLGIDETLKIAESVAAALQFAHDRGIVHRDIKPENILLQAGQALVADFGIALAVREAGGARLTQTGLSVGTPHYMSPEQAAGDREVDNRSDVYSFGAVVYEMLVGDPPHTGSNVQALVARLLTEEPVPIRVVRTPVPGHIDTAVMRALAKTPADRFRTMAEFAGALMQGGGAHPERSPTGAPSGGRATLVTRGLGAVALAVALWMIASGGDARVRSLAVLPLQNLSGDSTQEYFVQGIHDALITELSQLSSLDRVISRTSVMRFRDSGLSLPEIGAALNVDAIVEGSVLRVGDDVRITVTLVQVSPERNLWANSYLGELTDVLALQRRVTGDIASEIALTLTPAQKERLVSGREVNPEAHDLYLRGRFHWNRRSEDGFRRSVDYFNQSIAIDPTYAVAHAGLSDAYSLLGQYGHMPLDEAIALARRTAVRAVELDSTLADAFTARAEVHFLEREWDDAERVYRRAIALNPGYATVHHFFGWFLSYLGRHDEAIVELERARELDPLSPIINADIAAAHLVVRRYDEAAIGIQRALEFEPGFQRGHTLRVQLHVIQGNPEDAFTADQRPLDGWSGRLGEAHVLAALGRRAEAESIVRAEIAAAGGQDNVGTIESTFIAMVYIALGDNDVALNWLEQAVDHGLSAGAHSLKVWPFFDPLRSHPRFAVLLEQMGFPE